MQHHELHTIARIASLCRLIDFNLGGLAGLDGATGSSGGNSVVLQLQGDVNDREKMSPYKNATQLIFTTSEVMSVVILFVFFTRQVSH